MVIHGWLDTVNYHLFTSVDHTRFTVESRNDVAGDGDGLWGKTIALYQIYYL